MMTLKPIKLKWRGKIIMLAATAFFFLIILIIVYYVAIHVDLAKGSDWNWRLIGPMEAFSHIFGERISLFSLILFSLSVFVTQFFGWGFARHFARRWYENSRSKFMKSNSTHWRDFAINMDYKIYRDRNTTFMSLGDLDEAIMDIYKNSNGFISLFNPPRELFEPASEEFNKVRAALEKRSQHITYLEAALRPEIYAKVDAASFANSLGWKTKNIRLKEIDEDFFLKLAKTFRAAIYTVRKNEVESNTAREIGHFLFRPMHPPFYDGYVFIQEKEALELSADPNDPDQVNPYDMISLKEQVWRFMRGELTPSVENQSP